MSTSIIFRFEGEKLLEPFLIPQSLFAPQLQGDPAAREMRRQQERTATHLRLKNIRQYRDVLDKSSISEPLDSKSEVDSDFSLNKETVLEWLRRWSSRIFSDKQSKAAATAPSSEEDSSPFNVEPQAKPTSVHRQRTASLQRDTILDRLLSMDLQEYIDFGDACVCNIGSSLDGTGAGSEGST